MHSAIARADQPRPHQFNNIPIEMRAYNQWVGWTFEQRDGTKPTKVPRSIADGSLASVTDPKSWASFLDTVAAYEAGNFDGIGFVFTSNDPFAGIDLDDGDGDVAIKDRQDSIFDLFPSYAEISPSGMGLHIIVKGSVPQGRRRDCVEVYCTERYFTMTGNVYRDEPISEHAEVLNSLWQQMRGSIVQFDARGFFREAVMSDEAVYDQAANAKANGEKFVRLWNGEASAVGGTDHTPSAVDQALANMLVWHTKDPYQVERLLLACPHGQRAKMQNRPKYRYDTIVTAFDREIPVIEQTAIQSQLAAALAAGTFETPKNPFEGFDGASGKGFFEWPDPVPLPSGLSPVAPFDPRFLPEGLAPWASDIADRMQCPPDYPAAAVIVAAGATVGGRIGIRPKSKDSWTVVPNLWGMIVGRPGVMKSPAITEALGPLKRFEAKARKENDAALAAYKHAMHEYKVRSGAAERAYKDAKDATAPLQLPGMPAEPSAKRRIVADTTYEALGVILGNNPNGVLCHRDELASLLKHVDRRGKGTPVAG